MIELSDKGDELKMADLQTLARYLVYAYENLTNSHFENSELKLHKLLYFAQRESLALTGEPLFQNDFEGWRHGPVIPDLRFFFENDYSPFSREELEIITEDEKYIISNTLDQFAKYESWSLRDLSHQEDCWIKSREGLDSHEPGYRTISAEDIKSDAKKVRPYDHIWGMYLDEFEDDPGSQYVQ